jgi:two-component system, NarL family, nitrate/nitrite response regulator NarL
VPKQPIKVLLVDDHEHVLWGLGKLIDGEWPRMTVIGAVKTFGDAQAMARELMPDVIVLDIFLNDGNSVDRLPELLAECRAPIVMLTGSHESELHHRALSAGARIVLSKEQPAEVILSEIERANESRDVGMPTRQSFTESVLAQAKGAIGGDPHQTSGIFSSTTGEISWKS